MAAAATADRLLTVGLDTCCMVVVLPQCSVLMFWTDRAGVGRCWLCASVPAAAHSVPPLEVAERGRGMRERAWPLLTLWKESDESGRRVTLHMSRTHGTSAAV